MKRPNAAMGGATTVKSPVDQTFNMKKPKVQHVDPNQRVFSPLQQERADLNPELPSAYRNGLPKGIEKGNPTTAAGDVNMIAGMFPNSYGQPMLKLTPEPVAGQQKVNLNKVNSCGRTIAITMNSSMIPLRSILQGDRLNNG